jgi:hypothetical protein
MAHEVKAGSLPGIVIQKILDPYNIKDMTAVESLGLDKGKRWILLDVSEMSIGLPENFLEGARNSYFLHENMMHMALYTKSDLLATIGRMVAKLTHRQDKLSVHQSFEAAETHLVALIHKSA